MRIPGPLAALLQSRKFWLAVLGVVSAVVLYVQQQINADTLVTAIVALVGIVIAAIGIEDAGSKAGGGNGA